MVNKNYVNGRAKEYRVMKKLRKLFPDALITRSAGSHSKIDVILVDGKTRIIKLIQCKPMSLSYKNKVGLENELINKILCQCGCTNHAAFDVEVSVQ